MTGHCLKYQGVHYASDGIEACVEQPKAAAGDRDVMLRGAYTGQRALYAPGTLHRRYEVGHP